MSTSIAALPAYRTSKAERTEARANRTIFGTTLDNSTKAHEVLLDEKVNSSADQLHKSSKKWRTPTPKKQALLNAAWGIKDYSQAEIGEEQIRSYSKISFSDTVTSGDQFAHQSVSTVQAEEQEIKAPSLLFAYKDRFGVYNVGNSKLSVGKRSSNSKNSGRPLGKPRSNPRKRRLSSMCDVTNSARSKQSNTPQTKTVQVPKFPLPPGKRNYLRTASLKITETGAKDLINSRSVNKVGLGGTTQFNHESFKKREAPNQYVDHGNVFSLGQKGHSRTTNSEVTGPGGFYKLSTTDSNNSKSCKDSKDDADSMYFYSMPYEPSVSSSRRTHHASAIRNQAKAKPSDKKTPAAVTDFEDVVPLNILHKYGADEVRKLLSGKELEVEGALEKANESSLSHSGMVPPRTYVPELNHPINPPATYYSNFGQSLKYDKFEGGLHLYIN